MTNAAAIVQGILLTFALVVILMTPFIALLRRLGFGTAAARGLVSRILQDEKFGHRGLLY